MNKSEVQAATMNDRHSAINKAGHKHDYLFEKPCCSGFDSLGNPDCACGGHSSVACLADRCPGITEQEADEYFKSMGEPDYMDDEDLEGCRDGERGTPVLRGNK